MNSTGMDAAGLEEAEEEVLRLCPRDYALGRIQAWKHHGGTAGKNWVVTTDQGVWLVRLRGSRTSSAACLRFDHSFRRFLIGRGVPTAAPLRTRDGASWVRRHDRVYEVYPFLSGETLEEVPPRGVWHAARALARLHMAARAFPLAHESPPIAQYATLGIQEASPRLEDPRLLTRVYDLLGARPDAQNYAGARRTAAAWLARLREAYGPAVYGRLPGTVVHGDYTPANILFTPTREVAGIFDFDWARRDVAVRDVADGMLFVAGRRRSPLRSGDIWSLTEPVDLESDRCVTWLTGYSSIRRLAPEELDALPLALAARWLSVRAEGTAKVARDAACAFCFGPLADPLEQLESRWPSIRRACERAISETKTGKNRQR